MGKLTNELLDEHLRFIAEQKMFFVATAAAAGRVNVSPKGMDSLRVVSSSRVVWLNLTGSNNETSAHVQQNPRMTLMFCAFAGEPWILRIYGQAQVIHKSDAAWDSLHSLFPPLPGARQIFDVTIDSVQTSCGAGVPLYSFTSDRDALCEWATQKGDVGLRQYWKEKNEVSLDGMPTQISVKNEI